MALANDPEKRKRQLETLAAGRRIAAERRAAGLPTKRSEKRRAARVVDDDYAKPAPPAKPKGVKQTKPKRRAPRAPAKDPAAPAAGGRKRDLLRAAGDILGSP